MPKSKSKQVFECVFVAGDDHIVVFDLYSIWYTLVDFACTERIKGEKPEIYIFVCL